MKENNFSDLYKTHILGIFDNDSKFEMKIGGRHGKGIRCIKVRQYVYEDVKKTLEELNEIDKYIEIFGEIEEG